MPSTSSSSYGWKFAATKRDSCAALTSQLNQPVGTLADFIIYWFLTDFYTVFPISQYAKYGGCSTTVRLDMPGWKRRTIARPQAPRLRLRAVHQRRKLSEQVAAVVGPGSRFGVVLDAEYRTRLVCQTLDRLVIQIDMRNFGNLGIQ